MKWVSENQVFRSCGEAETYVRVLWVRPDGQELVLFDLDDPRALPRRCGYDAFLAMVEIGELEPCLEEPAFVTVPTDSSLSEAARRRRDEQMGFLRELIEDPERGVLDAGRRHTLFRDIERRTGRGRNYLYAYMRLWWRGGQVPNTLAPRYAGRGGPGKTREPGEAKRGRPVQIAGTERLLGINIDPKSALKLQQGKRFLIAGKSWHQAYDSITILNFSERKIVDGQPRVVIMEPGLRPSFQQFVYWVKKVLEPGEIERAVRGEAAYARNMQERSGSAREGATGPGSIFQIDATLANLYLRSRTDPSRFVGRPVLYLVTDQYSGMIVGFTVALSPPSWEIAKLAFENAFTDKVESCGTLGVKIKQEDWPSRHLCSRVTGDRAWDVLGINLGEAALGLGTHVANLPPYRPDLKSLVENKFEWLDAQNISWAPGATHGRKRGDVDDRPHDLDGCYDLDTFREFMIYSIIRHNSTMKVVNPPLQYPMTDGRSPTPNDLWNHGCRHLGAPRLETKDRVRAHLLHVDSATMRDNGLKFGRLMYAPVSDARRRDFDRARGRSWNKLVVKHDPRNVSSILAEVSGGHFEPFQLAPAYRRFDGWTREEVAVFHARRVAADFVAEKERLEREVHYRENVVELDRIARSDAAAARDGKDAVPKSKRVRLAGNAELMAQEIREERRAGSWTSLPREAVSQPSPVVEQPVHVVSQAGLSISLKPDRMELLRRIQKTELLRQSEKNRDES